MDKDKIKLLLISTFNIQNLANYLDNDDNFPLITSKTTAFGQVIPTLIDNNIKKNIYDTAVVWTQPDLLISSFNKLLENERISTDEILHEVDNFADAVISFSEKVNFLFIPIWVLPSYYRGYGILDFRNSIGISNTLSRMNLRLADKFENTTNIFLLDTNKWLDCAGTNSQNPKLWYLGKIPFSNEVFKIAKEEIKSAINVIKGNSKKIIILDLDDTLWGGIIGDIGWENIQLGGHDHIGEAFSDFQLALKGLSKRGILLAIVSKNEESNALEAFKNHPEMILKLDDFIAYRINWEDKAKNIAEILSEVNLGAQSAVFLDDNPVERSRVIETLPEILVPALPENKLLYKSFLLNLRCFDSSALTEEDINRTKMYLAAKKIESLKTSLGSVEDWLKTLDTRVKIDEVNKVNLLRTVQLINKTNQMNLSTRRISETELLDWLNQDNKKMWTFSVSDKFSDSGLTGIISVDIKDNTGQIIDFILSCRVMGRHIEEAMIHALVKFSKEKGLKILNAEFIPTKKNKPCYEFWRERSGFKYNEKENNFYFNLKNEYPLPEHIKFVKE